MKPEQPLEIERKFLIAYPDVDAIAALPGCKVSRITQTYLLTHDGSEARVRMRETDGRVRYVYTVKRAVSGMTREETETEITPDAYRALLAQADPNRHPVKKTRYALPFGALTWEIDIYPFWADRAIAEVELASETQAIAFPPQLTVLREVTDNPAYKNSTLAKCLPG